jgi:predicted DNA-binding antitoxin AbrB/MazE fold protein
VCLATLAAWNLYNAGMKRKTFEAVYENGVLRPLGQIDAPEHARVKVTIHAESQASTGEAATCYDLAMKAGMIGALKDAFSDLSTKIPDEVIQKKWPGGFNLRDEANAIVAYAFRNGPIEDLHAGKYSELLERTELSRITDAEMKEVMINACEKMEELLKLRESDPEKYAELILHFNFMYCRRWNR